MLCDRTVNLSTLCLIITGVPSVQIFWWAFLQNLDLIVTTICHEQYSVDMYVVHDVG